MAPKTPKYLIQKFPQLGLGRIFLHTDALAKRPDMEVYEDPVPLSMEIKLCDVQTAKKHVPYKTSMEGNATYPPETPSLPVPPVSAVPAAMAGTKAAGTGASQELETGNPASEEGKGDGETDAPDMTPVLTPEEKHAKLVEAIGTLNPDDSAHFTDAGMPRVDVLMAALGMDVEGKEREAAWKAFQETKKK